MVKCYNYKLFYFLQDLLMYFPFKAGIYLRRTFYKPFFREFGKGIVIHDNVHFKFPSETCLGNRVQIAKNCLFSGGSGLKIGNNVLIGAGTKIVTSTHNHDNLGISIIEQGLSFKPIVIKDDVWFGFNVVVLSGVSIGNGVIVGANAVVNKDIPDLSIIAGVPAKIIKTRM